MQESLVCLGLYFAVSLTDVPKFTAPLTIDTCTEEGAALSAFVNVVHITELHPNIRIKHITLVANSEVYTLC